MCPGFLRRDHVGVWKRRVEEGEVLGVVGIRHMVAILVALDEALDYLWKLGPSFFLPPDNETISMVSVSGQ